MAFSPASLALTGWWKAPFPGSFWVNSASAGTSGGNGSFTEATNPPSVGALAFGYASADFDGVNDQFHKAQELDTYLSTSAYSVSGVVAADTTAARSVGAAYTDAAILSQDANGLWYVTFTNDGITGGHYTGSVFAEITQACPADGKPHTYHFWYDGTNLNLTVDGVSAAPVLTANSFGFVGFGVLIMGRNYNTTTFLDGRVWETLISNVDLGGTARASIEAYFRDRYFAGYQPPVYSHRVERRRPLADMPRGSQGPIAPVSSALALLQPIRRPGPDSVDRRGLHASRMPHITGISPLPIPTDTTAFAQMRAAYPDRVSRPTVRTANQDAFEMGPPIPVIPIVPTDLARYPVTIARLRPKHEPVRTSPAPVAAATTPIALTEYSDTVPRPRFGAWLQAHITSLSPRPERTSPLVDVDFPDRVPRPRVLTAHHLAHSLPPQPEQKVALGFQGRFPSEVRRPVVHARHQPYTTFWPLPIPTPPVVAVPIVTQTGTVSLLGVRGVKVAVLDQQTASVSLLTARGVRVVVLDSQSGTVTLLSARTGKVE